MVLNRRRNPPHSGQWETPTLDLRKTHLWVVRSWPPQILNQIRDTLADALLTPHLIRFFRSNLQEWSDDQGWRCQRFLGAGAYGSAAVWTRQDDEGNLVDEVVVKEDKRCHGLFDGSATGDVKYLAREATNQALLNRLRPNNIVHLRAFKAIIRLDLDPQPGSQSPSSANPPAKLWRFYQEYAPYGNLYNLQLRYKAFKTYLPELFLWHVFNSLARAILAFEESYEVLKSNPDQDFVFLHFDIKPENIFLGYEGSTAQDPDPTFQPPFIKGGLDGEAIEYPTIKIGDYGLSQLLLNNISRQVAAIGSPGTPYYKAPELYRTKHLERGERAWYIYGEDWNTPINRSTDIATNRVNVWNVGKIMYDIFSHSDGHLYEEYEAKSHEQYMSNGNCPISDYNSLPFSCDSICQHSPYTQDLSDLIERCMHVEPSRRPTAQELFTETRSFLQTRSSRPASSSPFSVRQRKLYYYGQEINNMPIVSKNCHHRLDAYEYSILHAPGSLDPDGPALNVLAERVLELGPGDSRAERKRDFEKYRQYYMDDTQFSRRIIHNTRRLRRKGGFINVQDPDQELTYSGTADQQFFYNEDKETRSQRPNPEDNPDEDNNRKKNKERRDQSRKTQGAKGVGGDDRVPTITQPGLTNPLGDGGIGNTVQAPSGEAPARRVPTLQSLLNQATPQSLRIQALRNQRAPAPPQNQGQPDQSSIVPNPGVAGRRPRIQKSNRLDRHALRTAKGGSLFTGPTTNINQPGTQVEGGKKTKKSKGAGKSKKRPRPDDRDPEVSDSQSSKRARVEDAKDDTEK